MLKLEQIEKNALISGLEPGLVVRVVSADFLGESISIYYKRPDSTLGECMQSRADEANLSLAEAGRHWAFDAQGAEFKLAIVFVDGEEYEGPHYVRNPFMREPDWAATSVNYDIADLLQRKEETCA